MEFVLPQIAEIEKRLTGFHLQVFAAALKSFGQPANPLRVNNLAMNLRELSRLILDELSPEGEIKQCCWFSQELDQRGNAIITRAQRIRYAVQAGLTEDFVKDELAIDVPQMIRKHGKIADGLSKFTHLGKKTFGVDENTANRVADTALDMFMELLQMIDECRAEIYCALEGVARGALDEVMIGVWIFRPVRIR